MPLSLVVDDGPSIRRYVNTILQREDFRTLEAESGRVARLTYLAISPCCAEVLHLHVGFPLTWLLALPWIEKIGLSLVQSAAIVKKLLRRDEWPQEVFETLRA